MIPYPLLTIIHFHPQILTCNLFHMHINSVLGNIKLLLIPLPCTLSRNEGKNTEHGNIVDVGDREVYSHQVKVETRANNIKEKWKTSNTIFTFTRCEYSLMLNQTTNYSVSQHHVSKIPTSKCSTRRYTVWSPHLSSERPPMRSAFTVSRGVFSKSNLEPPIPIKQGSNLDFWHEISPAIWKLCITEGLSLTTCMETKNEVAKNSIG